MLSGFVFPSCSLTNPSRGGMHFSALLNNSRAFGLAALEAVAVDYRWENYGELGWGYTSHACGYSPLRCASGASDEGLGSRGLCSPELGLEGAASMFDPGGAGPLGKVRGSNPDVLGGR